MKKILFALLCVGMLLAFAACTSTNTYEETCNGITKTVTETKSGGETTETVVYTDADGNTLDEEIGEAAFAAAKAGDEHPLDTVLGTSEEAEETETGSAEEPAAEEAEAEPAAEETEEAAEEESSIGTDDTEEASIGTDDAAAEEEDPLVAPLYLDNELESDITELYFVLAEDADDAENILDEDTVIPVGATAELGELTWYPDETVFMVGVVTAAGDSIDFGETTISAPADGETITITFSEDEDSYHMHIG